MVQTLHNLCLWTEDGDPAERQAGKCVQDMDLCGVINLIGEGSFALSWMQSQQCSVPATKAVTRASAFTAADELDIGDVLTILLDPL